MNRDERTCVWCGGHFFMLRVNPWTNGDPRPARSNDVHRLDPDGRFCKLRCAAAYGVFAYERRV